MIYLIGLALAIAGGIVLGHTLSQPGGLRRLGLGIVQILTRAFRLLSTGLMIGFAFYLGPTIGWSVLAVVLGLWVLGLSLHLYARYVRGIPAPPARTYTSDQHIWALIFSVLWCVLMADIWITTTLLPSIDWTWQWVDKGLEPCVQAVPDKLFPRNVGRSLGRSGGGLRMLHAHMCAGCGCRKAS